MKIRAFISYSHKDADLLSQLHEHLSVLKRENLLETWTDRQIQPGDIIDETVAGRMDKVELFLLLVSSSFIHSNYCFEKEFAHASDRHAAGKVIIVPIILRECDWNIPALRQFKALPEDAKPVISRHWHTADEAFANITAGLRELIKNSTLFKNHKEKFVPDETHISKEQRDELGKLVVEVVDRLIAWAAGKSDAVVQKQKGRNFRMVWSQFNEEFETKSGLSSLPKEKYEEARKWLLQYRASKSGNLKRHNPQKYRDELNKTIYTIAGKLGWSKSDLYNFVSEKLEVPPISSLNDLGDSQLKLARDRVRYESTKQTRPKKKKK